MSVLLKPVITEKMTGMAEKLNRYGFLVDRNANKIQIRHAVEKMYGVTVEDVNTMRYAGKVKSRNTKRGFITGRTKAYKKAVVTLAKGETIDFYSSI